MSDEDADRLRDALDMALHLHPKHPAINPPLGVAPLPFGGLFLVRGRGDREWALEGRTWASPSAAAVRESELEAILAARLLDPSVPYPRPPRRRLAVPPQQRRAPSGPPIARAVRPAEPSDDPRPGG